MFKIIPLIGLLSIGSLSATSPPSITLYDSPGCTGLSYEFVEGSYIHDLAFFGFDNRAASVSILGPWIFYDLTFYNTAQQSEELMEYIYSSSKQCVDFTKLSRAVTSIKFSGHELDFQQDFITFYEFPYFQGYEEFNYHDFEKMYLHGRISSLIVTGTSAWTIYDQPYYAGNALCVSPGPNHVPGIFPDTTLLSPSFPHGSIASARKGCFA